MNITTWLTQEMNKKGWDKAELARQAGLRTSLIEAVLGGQHQPDFEFCYNVAQALDKRPERLLHMAGLLSPPALKLANELTSGLELSAASVRRAAAPLSVDERRLILACTERRGPVKPIYDEIRPTPDEFNPAERHQDRIRFAVSILFLFLGLMGVSLAFGFILL